MIMGEEVNRRIIYPDDKPIQQNGLTMPINIPIPVLHIHADIPIPTILSNQFIPFNDSSVDINVNVVIIQSFL